MSRLYPEQDPRVAICPASGELCANQISLKGLGVVEKCKGEILVVADKQIPDVFPEGDEYVIDASDSHTPIVYFCGAEVVRRCTMFIATSAAKDGCKYPSPIDEPAELSMAALLYVNEVEPNLDLEKPPKFILSFRQAPDGRMSKEIVTRNEND